MELAPFAQSITIVRPSSVNPFPISCEGKTDTPVEVFSSSSRARQLRPLSLRPRVFGIREDVRLDETLN